MLEHFLQYFQYFPGFNDSLQTGTLVFVRFLSFVHTAPILSRKDVPINFKMGFVLLMTITFMGVIPHQQHPPDVQLVLPIILNILFGALLGFTATMIFVAVQAAGEMNNMHMGLSASTMFNPGSREQSSLMGNVFNYLAVLLFINSGGIYWLLSAFQRGFSIFPLYGTSIPVDKVLSLPYMTSLISNIMVMGIQLSAPILIASLALDTILGVISKTAPQVNVFQLSFLFKPVMGTAILIVLLPLLISIINDYFNSYARIF